MICRYSCGIKTVSEYASLLHPFFIGIYDMQACVETAWFFSVFLPRPVLRERAGAILFGTRIAGESKIPYFAINITLSLDFSRCGF